PVPTVPTVPIDERLVVEAFQSGLEGIDPFSAGSEGQTKGDSQGPAIARMAFSAFDFDFCVRIPPDAVDIAASEGLKKSADGEEPNTWCTERLVTDDLMKELWAVSEPPMSLFDQKEPMEPEALAALPFTCRRHEDESTVARKIWDRILPRPFYELTWRRPAIAGAATSG
ncbi:MAG TPA: hypothetical protein VFE84_06955, partial [Patescibacteria group bacterium]|nr:hypothetical protein [Patescibacteria group bacterium]